MTNQSAPRIAVLLGGSSNEKNISLESGRNVVYKIPQPYHVFPVFVSSELKLYLISHEHLVHNSVEEIEQDLHSAQSIRWADLPSLADFVFIALHGGVGENGCVQGALELLGVPYNGSGVFASALCMDKYKTTQFLRARGFEVPQGMLINRDEWVSHQQAVLSSISTTIPFPLIIKPHDDGCSVLVHKATTAQELETALTNIFTQKKYALVEECIIGMELTVGVLGNQNPHALPPSQALASKGILSIQEKFLPGAGENQTPAPLPEPTLQFIQRTIEAAYKTVDCRGYARIDCFYQSPEQSPTGKERVVILEFNTLPGLTPATVIFHQAAEIGLTPSDFLGRIIEYGFENHKTTSTSTGTIKASSSQHIQPVL